MYDAVIIGGGMSGLAAGIRLAHFDLKVCLLEKHNVLGGLNSFYKHHQHLFDVGLHALTNYSDGQDRSAPLAKLIRQLRLNREELALAPQYGSAISFPGIRLQFTNDICDLENDIAAKFPKAVDGFRKLTTYIREFDDTNLSHSWKSAREVLDQYVNDPLLADMLLCPLMYYGSADETDMDWTQFAIMFKAIFLEGFCRPNGGVRRIIRALQRRFRESGGEFRMQTGVRTLHHDGNKVTSIELDSGETIQATNIISSAGYVETLRLAHLPEAQTVVPGRMSFVESISVLQESPTSDDFRDTIVFYNNQNPFKYRQPSNLADSSSGVICFPDHYEAEIPPRDSLLRITNMANYQAWKALSGKDYAEAKQDWFEKAMDAIRPHVPDFSGKISLTDIFSPVTVEKFTGHINGAVYGSPQKVRDGHTPLGNLFLTGTDQGFLGVVGAMLSGITIANLQVLQRR